MRALVFALAAALATILPAQAGDVSARLERSDIEVRARSAWPANLNKGWAPLRLELHNRSSDPVRVRLDANAADWQLERTLERSFELAPGERVDTELLLPAGGQWANDWDVRLRTPRGDDWRGSGIVAGGGPVDYRATLAVSDEAVAPSMVAQWSERISREVVNNGYVAPGTTPINDDIQVGHARYDDLARTWGAYSSLDLVVVDARAELPPEASLEPLAAWVRSGGVLLVAGARGRELALERGSLAPWMEPRFAATLGDHDAQHCGLGLLVFQASDRWMDDEALRASIYELASDDHDMAPRRDGISRVSETLLALPGIGELPYQVFVLLLILFGIVIGPLNFLWIARKRRPVLLLITIPAIALVTTVALLVYGIYFQGLDVKLASQSMALLDERLHRSSCVEQRLVYAGMSPGAGLRPEPGTVVHFLDRAPMGTFSPRGRHFLRLEQDPSLLLAGDYLPTRIPVQHVVQGERAARGRLEASRVDGGLVVRNGLGARIESLVARDERGAWYASSGPIDVGASATLAPTGAPKDADLATKPADILWRASRRAPEDMLPAACYLARLERSPFRDFCGIEMTELASDHRVLGIWDLQSEAWK